MDVRFFPEGRVAHPAESGDLLNELERLPPLLRMGCEKRLMTAVAHLGNRMEVLHGEK
jgi:hypothetical protein